MNYPMMRTISQSLISAPINPTKKETDSVSERQQFNIIPRSPRVLTDIDSAAHTISAQRLLLLSVTT